MIETAPVFHATEEDMQDSFGDFVEAIDARLSGPGICKIVPPKGWTPRKQGYNPAHIDFQIPHPIRQIATGTRGLYRLLLVSGKTQDVAKEYAPMATDPENQPPASENPQDLERRFWRSLSLRPPLYGADVEGSLFDDDLQGWNLRRLDSLLTRTLEAKKMSLPGVTTPYLYFGMWRSIFAWHTEDVDLHSVNYLHYGAPKSWYCIPPAHRARFELLVKGMLPDMFRVCPQFLRHKEILVSPELLRQHNIPVVRMIQYPGEWIISAPGAYHSGFNHGYNCAESTNFATSSWLPFGAVARPCYCRKDTVQIQMTLFLDAACPAHKQAILDAASSDDSSGDEASCDESQELPVESSEEEEESLSRAESSSSHYDTSARSRRPRSQPKKQPTKHPQDLKAAAQRAAAAELAKASRARRASARAATAEDRDCKARAERSQQAAPRRVIARAVQTLDPHTAAAGKVAGPSLLRSESDSQGSQQDTIPAHSASPGKAGKKGTRAALRPQQGRAVKHTRSTGSMHLRSGASKTISAVWPSRKAGSIAGAAAVKQEAA